MRFFCTFFLALFCLFPSVHYAQSTISATVLDADSMEPLPYVNIGIQGTSSGTVSDDQGRFEIDVKSMDVRLMFSYLGYESQELEAAAVNSKLVLLQSKPFEVEEISIVSSNFSQEVLLGVRNEEGRGPSFGFGNAQLGTELATVLLIDKETYIKSAHFVLNHAKGDSLLLRLNIYDYADGEIGEKVLLENVYIREKQRKGTFNINLEAYELLLYDDVLISLEWLKDFDETGNRYITFDMKKAKKKNRGGYIRTSQTSVFIKPPLKTKFKPCIYLVGRQGSE